MRNSNNYPYRSYDDLFKVISTHACTLPTDIDLIVGIPRSGMVPAYMLGLLLNKPVCTLNEYMENIDAGHGERVVNQRKNVERKCILFVDDSIHSGVQLEKTKNKLRERTEKERHYYLAIFARAASKDLVDFYFEIVETPRIFQWNYLYQGIVKRSCFDIDGVLCEDPLPEQNDDGEKYIDFILNAKPLYIPKEEIYMLVTSRLEKYRKETEQWLKQNNVRYKKLVMLDLPSKAERIKQNAHASFKAQIYQKEENAAFFYESERKQAIYIAAATKKSVFCVGTGELFNDYHPEVREYFANNRKNISFLKGKRILLYTQELTYTGSPHSLLRMARAIKKEGAYVEVWSRENGNFIKEFEKENIKVSVYENPFLETGKCAKMISTFDLAISNTVLTEKFYMCAKDIIPTIWYIREAHNLPAICVGNPARENALKTAERLYCVSEYAADFIKTHYNSSVVVVHNCVEDYFTKGDTNIVKDDINIMAMGTVNYRKSFDVFINAYFELPEEYQKKIHLYFAGRLLDECKDFWEPIMKKIEGNSNITFLGEISDTKEKIEIMKEMNVFCIVSRDESCSLVTLEAAMLGKAIIVSENIGAKYIVSEENGWTIETGNEHALANVYKQIAEHPERLKKMGECSRNAYLSKATIPLYNKNIVEMVLQCLRELNYNYDIQQNEILRRTEMQLKKTQIRLKEERENSGISTEYDMSINYKEENYNIIIQRLNDANYRLEEIQKSKSYKIGRVFTWGFRHLRHLITGAPV